MANTYEDLFKQSGVTKRLLVSFPNLSVTLSDSQIVSESMELTESLCSDDNIRFGSCEASVFKLRILGNVVPLIGETCNVSMKVGDIAAPFPIGTFVITSDKKTADRRYRDIVGYDPMYSIINADVAAWYKTLNLPMSLLNFRNSFFTHLGIEQEEAELINDDITITRTISAEKMSGKAVISAICEINGVFGHIGRSGKFEYKQLPVQSPASIDLSLISSAKYEDYETNKFDKLQIRSEEGDIGVTCGSGDNAYIIEYNFLLYGKGTAELTPIAQNIFDSIRNVYYRPAKVECVGNPAIEVGSLYEAEFRNATIRSYVLSRTLKGIQALRDKIEAYGSENNEAEVNGIENEIIQLSNKSNVLKRTIEGTESKVTALEEATTGSGATSLQSQINQYAGQINMKVSSSTFDSTVEDLQRQIENSSTNYNLDYEPTLNNYPAWDWCASPLLDISLFDANGEIPWIYNDSSYSKYSRTTAFDESTGIAYRFGRNSSGEWGWSVEPTSEYGSVLRRLSEIEIDVDGITSRVEADYLTKDDASGTYATKSLLRSTVEQTEQSITSTVSGTYQTKNDAYSDLTNAKNYADSVGQSTLRSAESKIEQTATSITSSVSATYKTKSDAENDYTTLSSRITQNANSITSEVSRSTAAEGDLHSKIKQNADSITAEITRATEAEGTLSTSITANANSIKAEIKRATEAEGTMSASITANANSISAEITRATNAEGTLSSRISANASSISAEVSRATSAEGTLSSRISVTESAISSKVSKGSIISEINQTAESVTISASKINLNGVVNSTEFTSKYATIASLNVVDGKFDNLNASNITSGTLSVNRMDVDGLVVNKKFTSKYATITSLNAVSADVSTIKANYITASYINASNISACFNSPTSGSITVGSVRTGSFSYYNGSSYETLYPMNVTIDGKVYRLFGHV